MGKLTTAALTLLLTLNLTACAQECKGTVNKRIVDGSGFTTLNIHKYGNSYCVVRKADRALDLCKVGDLYPRCMG